VVHTRFSCCPNGSFVFRLDTWHERRLGRNRFLTGPYPNTGHLLWLGYLRSPESVYHVRK
jgi:hypothetical protein